MLSIFNIYLEREREEASREGSLVFVQLNKC